MKRDYLPPRQRARENIRQLATMFWGCGIGVLFGFFISLGPSGTIQITTAMVVYVAAMATGFCLSRIAEEDRT